MRRAASILAFALLTVFAADDNPLIIPTKFSHGRIILTARIAESGPLTFLLDSGCTIPTLRPELVDELKLTASGHVQINGIAGEERAPTYRNVVFDLDGVTYAPRRIASVPSERNERRRRDGVLDAGFFRHFVVEFIPGTDSLRLHSPTNFTYSGSGTIVPFRFRDEIPVIKGAVVLANGDPINAEFEIDTGCDSGLCLGEKFVTSHELLEKIQHRAGEKFGIGGSVDTQMGRVPALRLGEYEVKNVQTDFFLKGSPVDEPLAGHIGMAALGKQHVIFDYARKRLIIEAPGSKPSASVPDKKTP
jgi:hypothetical protein